jgi:HEAT repeat protein
MSCRLLLVLSLFIAVPALHAAPPAAKISPDDEKLLKDAKVATDAPALLDYLRKHTITAKEREKIDGLVKQLGDDSFKVREKASEDLLALGTITLPQLRRALNNPDEEVRERAREGIAAVEGKTNPALSAAVVRVLRLRAPADAVKTLLDYVPDAENDAVTEEVLTTLAVLGVKEKKVDASLVEALKDKQPARRAGAALVLGRSGTAEQRRGVQALLTDPDVRVRFRAAQGLLAARERTGVPVLIGLLSDAPTDLATRAEELLSCVAGGRGLRMPITDNVQQNRNVRNAWEQWWKQNGKIDLSRADVDLPPFNASLRARETARQFTAAVLANDKDKLDKLVETPFYTLGEQVLANREQTMQYLNTVMQNMINRGIPITPVVQGTMSVEEYMKSAQPREQTQLAKLRKNDVRVVLIQWPQNLGRGGLDLGDGVLFIRVAGDQPQVLGMSVTNDRILTR